MKWIILLSAVLFATSCSKGPAVIPTAKGSLNVDVLTKTLKTGLKAAEADAPVYVKGVTLTAVNSEYTKTSTQTFDFVGDGAVAENAIVMTDLTVGQTTISAKGIAANLPLNKGYFFSDAVVGDATDADVLKDRATAYAAYLRGDVVNHGVFARYASVEDANDDGKNDGDVVVSNKDVNGVSLQMETEDHRLAIILENPTSSMYDLEMTVYKKVGDVKTKMFSSKEKITENAELINQGEQVAYVINDEAATGEITYVLEVKYYMTDSHDLIKDKTITPDDIVVGASSNNTKLYRFIKGQLLTGSASVELNWVPLTEINSGENLTDE